MAKHEHENSTPESLREAESLRGAMPPAEQLAAEAIGRLIGDGYTSSVLRELSRPKLNELGRRLVTPGTTVNDAAVQWLEDEGVHLPKSNVYRFAQRFREVYKLVWSTWADKMLMAQLSADPSFDDDDLGRLVKNSVTRLIAQEVATANPEDLDTARLNAMLSYVFARDKGALEREKLVMAQAEAEHKAAKLTADIERIRADANAKRARLNEQLKALRERLDDLETAAKAGRSIDPAIFSAIKDQLLSLTAEGAEAQSQGGGEQ